MKAKESFILQMKYYFLQGLTPTMVADKLGINRKNINYYINKYNIEVLNKFYKYLPPKHDFFDNIDSEEKAYLLGFFLADGFLTNNFRLGIENSIDDEEILLKFKENISPDIPLRYRDRKNNGVKRKKQVIFIITSEKMFNTLSKKYNIIQNKTYNSEFSFNFDLIPTNLIRHFIRGFFDGDGSISFYKYHKTIYFNFSFVINSLNFCNQIAKLFSEKFNIIIVIYEKEGKTCKYYTLRFSCDKNRYVKMQEVYEYLYKDSNIYLKRKKEKFDLYLEYRANSLIKE